MAQAVAQAQERLEKWLQGLQAADGSLTQSGQNVVAGVSSFVFFVVLYRIQRYVTPWYFKDYVKLSRNDQRDWDTRLGTIIYSTYIVRAAVLLLVLDDYFFKDGSTPKILRTSPASQQALAISTGFFVYEFVVTVKYMMGGPAMVVHHLGSLACVGLALSSGDAHMFTIWMLSTECTTPFIALRFLLDKSGLKSSTWYGLNGLAILFSWMVARLATFPPFFYTVWSVRHEIPLINTVSTFLLMVFPLVLFCLNSFWFTKIVRGALKHFFGGKHKDKHE